MLIQEAIKSGKPFKREVWPEIYYLKIGQMYGEFILYTGLMTGLRYNPSSFDLLADDWELKE